MEGIYIESLTIEQYLMLTQENLAPSMVNPKEIDDMTIVEYLEYEATLKRRCAHSGLKVTNYNPVHKEAWLKNIRIMLMMQGLTFTSSYLHYYYVFDPALYPSVMRMNL
ncbi:hypothetical protein Tco_0550664 [Tanacetum coccineum]